MMVSLADFAKPQTTTTGLADFAGSKKLDAGTPVNQGTISNMAAHAAVLSMPEDILPTYSAVSNELGSDGKSPTLDGMLDNRKMLDDAANLDTVRNAMGDKDISTDEKTRLLNGYINMSDSPVQKSLGAEVTTQAAIADSSPNDNDETNLTRVDTVKTMDEVDAYNGWVTAQSNNIRRLSNENGFNSTLDVLETVIPFMSAAAQTKFSTNFSDPGSPKRAGDMIKAFTIMGESKQELTDAIAKMPVATRLEFAKKLVKMITSTNGSITSRPNDLAMINQLNDALTAGNYSTTSRVVDDVSSLADIFTLGLTGGLWKGAKVGIKALQGVTTTGGEAARIVRADAALARLNKVAEDAVAGAKDVSATPAPEMPMKVTSEAPAAQQGLSNEVSNQASFEDAYKGVQDIGNTPASGEVGNQASFEAAYNNVNDVKSVPPDENTVNSVRQIIIENVKKELNDMGAPPSTVNDVEQSLIKKINSTSLMDENLPKQITDSMRGIFRRSGLDGIDPATLKRIRTYVDARSSVVRRTVRTDVDFSSVSQRVAMTNPEKARGMLKAVEADPTDATAKALYGTTKTEAIANDVLPEIGETGGTVRGKVHIDDDITPDKAFIDQQKAARGDSHLSKAEKEATRNVVKNDWANVVGLVSRREMGTVTDTPTGVQFDQVFGPTDGGFASAKDAQHQIEFALKKYGVDKRHIEILKRDEQGNFSPVDVVDDTPGEYLARVKYNYEFSPTDTVSWTLLSAQKFWKFFNAISFGSGKQGGIFEHIMPGVNINDTLLTTAASNAADRSAFYYKGLEKLGREYGNKFADLSPDEQTLVHQYIIKANNERIKFNPLSLKAVGMSEKAIDTIRSWKIAQDTNWYFENIDLNKTLNAKGWQRYVDQTGNSDLIVKPVGKGALSSGEEVLDSSGNLVKLSPDELNKLYDEEGTIAVLRRPIEVNGKTVEHVLVKNASEDSYLRKINPEDKTLSYIDGHYTVRYSDPYFITKTIKSQFGKDISKAVATASTRKEAEALMKRLQATDTKGVYDFRTDVKKDPTLYDDFKWDEIVNSGRSSQRIRGARLADGSGIPSDLNHVHIETPEQSLIASFRSLSQRIAYRDYLETAKRRWLNQFGHLLKDADTGQFPTGIDAIARGTKDYTLSELADAKTAWRYINQIDSGYVNVMDDASKSFFNFMSDVSGRSKSWAWLEGPLRKAGEFGPTTFARKKAARILLSANPLGQLTLQAAQALPTLIATNPLAIPRIAARVVLLDSGRYGLKAADMPMWFKNLAQFQTGLSVKEAQTMMEHYAMSGFEAAVDANLLVRDNLTKLADRGLVNSASRVLSAPLDITQKLGFEAGENLFMKSVWLSEYDKLLRSGVAIDAEKLEQLNGKVRALTGNMNRAGMLPYNENILSAALQFLQAPHKALALIIAGHKGLSQGERLSLASSYILTFGIGGNWVTSQVDKMIPDGVPGKDVLKNGVADAVLNWSLHTLFNTDSNIAVGDRLRLVQFPDMFKFFQSVAGMQLSEMITASPSASLLFGNSPRVTQFVKEMFRPFMVPEDRTPEQMKVIGMAFANIFPGISNAFKAEYIMAHGRVMGTTGRVTNYHASYADALAKAFGFQTHADVDSFAFQQKEYEMSSQPVQDIRYLISETSRHLALKGISREETKYYLDMLAEGQRVYGGKPHYLALFQSELAKQASQGEYTIFNSVMKMAGYYDTNQLTDLVNTMPITQEQKDEYKKLLSTIESVK